MKIDGAGTEELINLKVASDGKKAVVVTADVIVNDWLYTATESSVCSTDDKFDPAVGIEIAMGRAIRSLGRQILAHGQSRVHRNDRAKKAQAEATAAYRNRLLSQRTAHDTAGNN